MNVFLWILAGVLAALFLLAGLTKLIQAREKLLTQLEWVEDFGTPVVRLIGLAELFGAIGLVLPAGLGVVTALTPIAATGLAVTMLLAVGVHIRRKEPQAVIFTTVLMIASAVVAWGRFGPYSL